jgi:hypothetical protein
MKRLLLIGLVLAAVYYGGVETGFIPGQHSVSGAGELPSGRTVLIAHNIDLAGRVDALHVGDSVQFYGEKHNGRVYQ